MIINFFKVVILLFTNIAFAEEFTPTNNPVSVSIVPSNGVFFVEDKYYFGVKIDLQKGWKTYWKNPGDAGAPLTIDWKDPTFANKLEVFFPFPEKFLDHGVSTIGYEDQVVFPVKVQKNEMDKINKEINLNYLVCKDICIPISETKKLKLNFLNEVSSDAFLKNYKTVPKR